MLLESFGLVDNLMIPGGVRTSGGAILRPGDVASGQGLVEAAAAELARRLGVGG